MKAVRAISKARLCCSLGQSHCGCRHHCAVKMTACNGGKPKHIALFGKYTEAKVDVTQEIEQRAQQVAQAGADHCTLCSTGCPTVCDTTLIAYNLGIC